MSEFLAEAAVRILPDTTGFRAQLEAELLAATRGLSVAIPVAAAPVAGPQLAAQTAAVREASERLASLGAQEASTAAATTTATRASIGRTKAAQLQAAAEGKLALAQEEVLNATTAVGAAQITAGKAAAALSAARRAEAALTRADSAATAQAVVTTLQLAEAENAQATAALRAAKATEAHAASMSFLGRGAGAAGLSMLSVRGATLAANSGFLAGAAAATIFAKSIQLATSFSQELNVFRVTVGATADEMARVSEEARNLGRDVTLPGVSAQDAAEAMTELAKAGLSVQDSLDGARGVLQLATAAQLSNADATTLAASALNSFGLGGDQAVHVADLLANAANSAQGGIEDMGLALRQSAGVARQVGISLDDTVALLTLLARNGLQGSDAGTALRTSLIRLIKPTTEARNVLKDLNIQLRDQAGNIRPEVFAEFARATAGLTRAQQDARAAIVFGQDAIRAEAILGREGAKGLDEMRVALEKQGTAAEVAGARTQGLAGQSQSLQNNLEDLGVTTGNLATPAVASLAAGANDLAKGFTLAAKAIQDFNDRGEVSPDTASLNETLKAIQRVSDERERFAGSTSAGFVPPSFAQDVAALTKRLAELKKQAEATGTRQSFLDRLAEASPEIKRALEDGVITPLEAVELRVTALGRAFVKIAPRDLFVGLGAAARSGIEDMSAAVRRTTGDLAAATASAVEDAGRAAVVQARVSGTEVGDALGTSVVEAARAAIKRNEFQLRGLAEEMNRILAEGGTPQQQIANLRRQAAGQQRIIDAAGPNAAGNRLKARREAQAELARINQQIASLEDQIVADQEKAANEARDRQQKAQSARDRADRSFIDSISGRLAGIDNRILAAETKNAIAQQIRLEKTKRDALLESITQVRETVKNAKTRVAELRTLTAELIRTNGEIASLTQEQRESEEKRIQEQRDAITEKLAKQAQLAELRGNDTAQLAAINRQIKDAQKRVAAAKKAKKGVLDEQIALQQLINQRTDLIKKIRGESDSGGGTTLADLFRENQRIFDLSGNVGTGPGRFPGSLTTGGANQQISQVVQEQLDLKATRSTAEQSAASKQAALTERLIRSLDLLNETIRTGGNRSTVVPARRGTGFAEAVNEHLRYVHATTARKLVEEST